MQSAATKKSMDITRTWTHAQIGTKQKHRQDHDSHDQVGAWLSDNSSSNAMSSTLCLSEDNYV